MSRRFAVLALVVIAGCGGGGGGEKTTATTSRVALGPPFDDIATLPGAQPPNPPWDAGHDKLQLRLREIGLPALSAEGQVVHIHQHLDLFYEGRKVTVPANIGIDPGGHFISPLHTHDTTGIIHVESPTESAFSLGQFFAVWGVPIVTKDRRPRAWVNGTPVNADPTRIVLDAHQEIVLAIGPAPKQIPSSYRFPEGL